ncbi:transposase [Sorangium sp. So ce1335]|uniref:transposase n=1 Tax=Sorangium sp. So ce1335 TaxID=3133335 RepID=UPI003F614B07
MAWRKWRSSILSNSPLKRPGDDDDRRLSWFSPKRCARSPKCFRHAHQLASYLGLVPLEDASGGRDKRRLGSIIKQGNAYLRALLTPAAHTILRHKNTSDR